MKRDLLESGKFSRKMRFIMSVGACTEATTIDFSFIPCVRDLWTFFQLGESFSSLELVFVEEFKKISKEFSDSNVRWFNFTSSIF